MKKLIFLSTVLLLIGQPFALANTCESLLGEAPNSSAQLWEDISQKNEHRETVLQKDQEVPFLTFQVVRYIIEGLLSHTYKNMEAKLTGKPYDIADLAERPTTPREQQVHQFIAKQVNQKKIEPFIRKTVEILKRTPIIKKKIESISPENLEFAISAAVESINALAAFRGLAEDSRSLNYIDSYDYSKNVENILKEQERVRTTPVENKLSDPEYMRELLNLAQAKYTDAKTVELLVDGPASFAKRDEMIHNAKENIDVVSWAVLDDMTGFDLAKKLVAKVEEGVQVRIIIDGMVSQRTGYGKALEQMERGGVQIIRWTHESEKFQGQHRKFMIVDGTHLVAGGMNPGDNYSHMNPKAQHWRDTDIYMTGNIVNQTNKLFADLWNQQIHWNHLSMPSAVPLKSKTRDRDQTYRVATVDSPIETDKPFGTPILLALMKGIRGAEKSIDIENAYVILFPSLLKEIESAIKRGVQVRVLTNSDKSLDEPIIALPILSSARKLVEVGAEVYLRKGTTLHSKAMSIDKRLVFIKAYNIHPRSERIEGEMAMMVDDPRIGEEFERMFTQDIHPQNAIHVTDKEEIKVPPSILKYILMRLTFDQL